MKETTLKHNLGVIKRKPVIEQNKAEVSKKLKLHKDFMSRDIKSQDPLTYATDAAKN